MTDVQADTSDEKVPEAPPAPAEEMVAAPPAGDPIPLGLLVFALGSTVLGISLLGYVPLVVQGNTIMPIVFAATGLGLLVTTVWAAALGQTFVATVLGAFACFWISYAALVLGLAHNWYGIPPASTREKSATSRPDSGPAGAGETGAGEAVVSGARAPETAVSGGGSGWVIGAGSTPCP